jgi:hypothetical protein
MGKPKKGKGQIPKYKFSIGESSEAAEKGEKGKGNWNNGMLGQ